MKENIVVPSLQECEALERDIISQNPNLLLKKPYLKIKVKNPEKGDFLTPFNLNPVQSRLLKTIEDLKKDDIIRRILVLKARQEGISTFSEAFLYSNTSQRNGIQSCIIADDKKGSSYLFDMSKLYHDELLNEYPHLAPEIKKSNALKLEFKNKYSFIMIDTADNEAAGQKYTYQYVHLSECAKFPYPEELMAGFLQSVPKTPESLIIVESTANGVGNWFHREVEKANNKETNWTLFFSTWYELPEYSTKITYDQEKYLEKTLSKEEKGLIEIHGCSNEQLWWRRACIINDCQGRNISEQQGMLLPDLKIQASLDNFHQYYPSTVDEAFISTGRSIFPTAKLSEMFSYAPRQIKTDHDGMPSEALIPGKNYAPGWLFEQEGEIIFLFDPDGPWRIFEMPEYGIPYCMGADVAEGIEIEEGTKKYDYSTMSFRRRDTLKQVAVYKAHVEPDKFATQVMYGCMMYNNCTAAVEANNHGLVTLKFLMLKYSNIYYSQVEDERLNKRRTKVGWLTTRKTKPFIVDEYEKALRSEDIIIRSKNGIKEARSFIRKPDGSMEAQEGCHDDEVIADMICVFMHKRLPLYRNSNKRKEVA